MVFRGGCSLILSLGNLNRVEYVIVKNIKSYDRYQEQVDYMNGDTGTPLAVSPYADDDASGASPVRPSASILGMTV